MNTEEITPNERIKNVFLHLRLPFSFFLAPVFFFALGQSDSINFNNTILLFIALHFFIYPGSNSYNSFMDRDEGSIGALEKPPPVTRDLYIASIIADTIGLLMTLFISIKMVPLMAVYIFISKIYSWHRIRLKKYPFTGWLVVVVFQGAYTFMLAGMSSENEFSLMWFDLKNSAAMLLSTLLIGAYYPLTQIYQHKEDSLRGDITISYLLGIRGTFTFTAIMFFTSGILSYLYFRKFYSTTHFLIFISCLAPAIIYFLNWFKIAFSNPLLADFSHTMRMTLLSSGCLLISFLILLYINHF